VDRRFVEDCEYVDWSAPELSENVIHCEGHLVNFDLEATSGHLVFKKLTLVGKTQCHLEAVGVVLGAEEFDAEAWQGAFATVIEDIDQPGQEFAGLGWVDNSESEGTGVVAR
jgi:hypothetical protein